MSLFLSLLSGLSAKVYDDINDNIVLQKFRKDTFMEFLKGIHYISLTSISIKEPLFFIIFCIAIVLNYFGNREEYSDPYERSLLYSFLLLFFILDYKKITNICLFDKLLLLSFCAIMFIEPISMYYFFENSEFSEMKLITRSVLLICAIILYFFVLTSHPLKKMKVPENELNIKTNYPFG